MIELKGKKPTLYARFSHLVFSALMCQTRLFVTLLVYSVFAVLLLTYVSAHILTGVLTQEIAELKQENQDKREFLSKLARDYFANASRNGVVSYCETVLGMVQATDVHLQRVTVRNDIRVPDAPEFPEKFANITDPHGFSLLDSDEGARR